MLEGRTPLDIEYDVERRKLDRKLKEELRMRSVCFLIMMISIILLLGTALSLVSIIALIVYYFVSTNKIRKINLEITFLKLKYETLKRQEKEEK